jgi:hypothetical protein
MDRPVKLSHAATALADLGIERSLLAPIRPRSRERDGRRRNAGAVFRLKHCRPFLVADVLFQKAKCSRVSALRRKSQMATSELARLKQHRSLLFETLPPGRVCWPQDAPEYRRNIIP